MKIQIIITIVAFSLCFAWGQAQDDELRKELKEELKKEILEELKSSETTNKDSKIVDHLHKIRLNGYGVVNYYGIDYDSDPELRNKLDAERLNLYLGYDFNDWITFRSEIEFEHGGTGATLELDTQEEFGEFEQEIEAGGEVLVEQVNVNFHIAPWLNIRAGRFKNYFGLIQNLDTPDEYFTGHRQEMENTILPVGFYENGIEVNGKILNNRILYRVALTSGFDATGFSSRNWIRGGHQKRFEMVNADALALTIRMDYKFGTHKNTYVGFAVYTNDTAANRPKDDMEETAFLNMAEAHITISEHPWRFNSVLLYGDLENSDIVSIRNTNLSNNLGVKKTPVGKNTLGFSAELGYDVLHLIDPDSRFMLYPFARYDFYDTMYDVEGAVVDDPRWERSSITGGINWFIHPQVIFKAHYSVRTLGSENYDRDTLEFTGEKQKERTFTTGIGFRF